jgi:hypothetical protein
MTNWMHIILVLTSLIFFISAGAALGEYLYSRIGFAVGSGLGFFVWGILIEEQWPKQSNSI